MFLSIKPSVPDSDPALTHYQRFLQPFQRAMFLFGLLYTDNPQTPCKLSPSKVLHLAWLLILWANVVRYFGAYEFGEKFDIPLIYKFIIHITFLWAASSITGGFYMSRVQPELFRLWAEYQTHYNVVYSEKRKRTQRQRVHAVLVCCILATMTVTFSFGMSAYSPERWNEIQVYSIPFYNSCWAERANFTVVGILVILYLLSTGTIFFELGYFLLLVIGIRDEFAVLNKDMRSTTKRQGRRTVFVGDLEHWRQRHSDVTALVRQLDDGIGLYVLLVFLSNVPICCFIVYILVMGQYPWLKRSFIWLDLWPNLLHTLSIMLVITYCGTKLNSEAVAGKDLLYSMYLDGDDWTPNRRLQVILLVVGYGLILLKFGFSSSAPLFSCLEKYNVSDTTTAQTD